MRRAARAFARIAKGADRFATSAARRAVVTGDLLRAGFKPAPPLERWPELASGRLALPIFDRIRRSAGSNELIVLVGHEPTLNEFLGLAIVGESVAAVRLTKGGAACVEFDASVRPGGGRLLWLLTRKQLADVRA